VLRGHDDVEPVRLAIDVRVHPHERLLQLLDGRVPYGPEHTQASGAAEGRGHLGRRREADDGELDAEQVADAGSHGEHD
jgi:hypothetical protein